MTDWDEGATQNDNGGFGGSTNEWNHESSFGNRNLNPVRGSSRGRIGVRGRGLPRGNFSTKNTSPTKESSSWGDEPNSVKLAPSQGGNENNWGDPDIQDSNEPTQCLESNRTGWNETTTENDFDSKSNSGWDNNSESKGWGGDSSNNDNKWAGGGDSFSGNDRGRGRGRGGGSRGGACFKCNQEGHFSRECPNAGSSESRRNQGCHNCGQDGHFSRDCPEPRKERGRECHNCGQEGHMSRECPEPRKPRGGGSYRGNRNSDSGNGRRGGSQNNSGGAWGNSNEDNSSGGWGNSNEDNASGGFDTSNQNNSSGGWGNSIQDTSSGGWGGSDSNGHENSYRGGGRGRGRGRGGSACFKCNEEGHMSRECPNNGGGSSTACFKCKEEGHMSRDCPSGGGKRGCHNCGQEGHFVRDCTEPRKEREPTIGEDGEEKPAPMTYIPEEREVDDLYSDGVDVGIHFTQHQNIPVKVTGEGQHPTPIKEFGRANLRPLIMANVTKARYQVPTPIQQYAIPIILSGRDMMACAQTGSGKTAGFLLPILHYIMENEKDCTIYDNICHPTSLIVAPTRELAIQIYDEARKFCNGSVVKVSVIYGGTAVFHQRRSIQNGCHILVATPGRLGDFVEKNFVALDCIKFLILDEADRMLDMGFIGDIQKLVNNPNMPSKDDRQTLMFSATFPTEIQNLASNYLNNYLFVAVGLVGAANADVKQIILSINKLEKRDSLLSFINEQTATNAAVKILVFVDKKRTADFLAAFLSGNDVNSTSIHGDRVQAQREQAIRDFKKGSRNVLVATAVAARGLDIKGVSYVLNYDLPNSIDEYVHRIGRTGRVGNLGHAISYFDAENDVSLAKDLIKVLTDAEQDIPDFLREVASGMGSTLSNQDYYMSTDVRSKRSAPSSSYEHTQAPIIVEQEEEQWS